MNTEAPKQGYAPRNALNAGDLKASIASRSRARGDRDEIHAWLVNHFYRHAVANFVPARAIESLEDARRALAPAAPPAWVVARFDTGADGRDPAEIATLAPVVWVDPDDPRLLALEHLLVEFLESRAGTSLAGKLHRINCPQALALWEAEHARMEALIERGWRESHHDALNTLLTTSSGRFVEFRHDSAMLRAEMAFESYAMRHCVGQFADRRTLDGGYGGRYAQAISERRMRLFSLRDTSGQPHVTISVIVYRDGSREVEQVKGKQNRPPIARYADEVVACLNAVGTNDAMPADCIAIGVVRAAGGWTRIEHIQDDASLTRLIARYPQLFRHLPAPSPMIEWLMAARDLPSLQARTPSAQAVRYALRTRHGDPGSDTSAFVTDDVQWPGFETSRIDTANGSRSET